MSATAPVYTEVLASARTKPVPQQSDAEQMAQFCDSNAQILLGAVSAQLLWEGAQKKNMTLRDLVHLIHNDKDAAINLMWI